MRASTHLTFSPLLAAVSMGHTLRAAAEPSLTRAVHTILVYHDRCTPLHSSPLPLPVPLPRASLLLCCGYADGSLRGVPMRTPPSNSASTSPPLPPPLLCWEGMHGGLPITCCAATADGTTLATSDTSGTIAVWLTSVHRSCTLRLHRCRGHLRGHTGQVMMGCAGAHQLLASVGVDGRLLLWDLRLLLLLHALDTCLPSPPPPLHPPAILADHLPTEVVGLSVKEETGETFVLTSCQLQMWSCNGTLLAASADDFPKASCLILTPTPEWMAEQLPLVATGHADGTVRWWTIREPTSPHRSLPRAISRLPVPSHALPAWELVERRDIRLQAAKAGVSVTALSLGSDQRSWAIGAMPEKLLFTGDAHGHVQSWKSSALDSGADGLPRSTSS